MEVSGPSVYIDDVTIFKFGGLSREQNGDIHLILGNNTLY